VAGLVGRDVLQVLVVSRTIAGSGEVGLGEFLERVGIELVLEMLELASVSGSPSPLR
jgi:hypothetical protein